MEYNIRDNIICGSSGLLAEQRLEVNTERILSQTGIHNGSVEIWDTEKNKSLRNIIIKRKTIRREQYS